MAGTAHVALAFQGVVDGSARVLCIAPAEPSSSVTEGNPRGTGTFSRREKGSLLKVEETKAAEASAA
jgi:hypothetical protein